MGIPDHLTCLLKNLYAGQEATVRTRCGRTDWFQIGQGVHQDCILSSCLFNSYAEYIMRNAGLGEAQGGIKIAGLLLLLSCFSRVQLLATPWTAVHEAPPCMGFSRQEYWSGVPSPSPENYP